MQDEAVKVLFKFSQKMSSTI